MSTRLADRLIAARHRRFVGRAAACDPFHSALAAPSRPHVILIDTCETLAPLDGWLRDTFLPQLPENTLVVLPAPADDAHLISDSAKAKRAEHCHPRPIS